MVAAVSGVDDLNAENTHVWSAVFIVVTGDGVDITLHVRGGYIQNPRLGRSLSFPIKYDKLLQSPDYMAQGARSPISRRPGSPFPLILAS